MVIHDLLIGLYNDDALRSYSSIHTTVSYNKTTNLATLVISKPISKYDKTDILLTAQVSLSQLKVKENYFGFNRVLNELTNKNSGVNEITFRWCINTTYLQRSGNWLDNNIKSEKQITISPVAVMMQRDGLYHHNTKPAVVDSKNNNVSVIEFYKHGKQCIPKEHPYPSSIVLSVQMSPIHESIDDSLRALYCRVPKTRWNWLNRYRKETSYLVAEQWLWEDKVIPEDTFPLVEYPIDDVGMFTIMMSI